MLGTRRQRCGLLGFAWSGRGWLQCRGSAQNSRGLHRGLDHAGQRQNQTYGVGRVSRLGVGNAGGGGGHGRGQGLGKDWATPLRGRGALRGGFWLGAGRKTWAGNPKGGGGNFVEWA